MPNKSKVREMFNSIAGDYDGLNHLMSFGVDKTWRRRSLKYVIDSSVPQKILDVACGTGDYSIAIARRMASGGSLTGIDLSEGMLAVMKAKIARADPKKYRLADSPLEEAKNNAAVEIKLLQCDAESLPFDDDTFDRVTIAFGIRNFSDRKAALREILRVLKPGGALVILELSVPENRFLLSLYKIYFKGIVPKIGGAISGDKAAYKYLPASVLAFPPRKQWISIMEECGYKGVLHKAYTCGLCRLYVGYKSLPGEKALKSFNNNNSVTRET